MEGTTKSPTFTVEFDKVCPCCGADCPNFEIEETSYRVVYYVEPGCEFTIGPKYRCKNEEICRATYDRYREMGAV